MDEYDDELADAAIDRFSSVVNLIMLMVYLVIIAGGLGVAWRVFIYMTVV